MSAEIMEAEIELTYTLEWCECKRQNTLHTWFCYKQNKEAFFFQRICNSCKAMVRVKLLKSEPDELLEGITELRIYLEAQHNRLNGGKNGKKNRVVSVVPAQNSPYG